MQKDPELKLLIGVRKNFWDNLFSRNLLEKILELAKKSGAQTINPGKQQFGEQFLGQSSVNILGFLTLYE